MPAEYVNGNVQATCPDCGAFATFEAVTGGKEFGVLARGGRVEYQGHAYGRTLYRLLRCASCGRGGLSIVHDSGTGPTTMSDFYPHSRETAPLPSPVPAGIVAEYREAELCASVGAHRAASALLRSVLEKTLKANGYTKGDLKAKINEAASDGVITAPRRQRAHDDIRVLGNDVLHDEWRQVTSDEYEGAHLYVQRILEDFYDNRAEVEAVLAKAKRIPAP
jgi:hypothetical protein